MPAKIMSAPPSITAIMRSFPSQYSMIYPKPKEAMISGKTMKKLKMPMYNPILALGRECAIIAYGIDKMDAQAIPTPVIETNSQLGFVIHWRLTKPTPPASRQMKCVV